MSADASPGAAAPPAAAAGLAGAGLDPAVGHVVVGERCSRGCGRPRRHCAAPAAAGGRRDPGAAAAAAARSSATSWSTSSLSGAQVAWRALGPGGQRQSAIVRVQLRADSDLLLTIIAETVSLVPGSLVLDLDREERLIAVHLLHVRDRATSSGRRPTCSPPRTGSCGPSGRRRRSRRSRSAPPEGRTTP